MIQDGKEVGDITRNTSQGIKKNPKKQILDKAGVKKVKATPRKSSLALSFAGLASHGPRSAEGRELGHAFREAAGAVRSWSWSWSGALCP